jgi:hypothetical protein
MDETGRLFGLSGFRERETVLAPPPSSAPAGQARRRRDYFETIRELRHVECKWHASPTLRRCEIHFPLLYFFRYATGGSLALRLKNREK